MLNESVDTASDVARKELSQFLRVAESIGMDADRQRRSLRLSRDDWQRWVGILHDAPVPAYPALPLMLRHIGYMTSRLDRGMATAVA